MGRRAPLNKAFTLLPVGAPSMCDNLSHSDLLTALHVDLPGLISWTIHHTRCCVDPILNFVLFLSIQINKKKYSFY
jgi:hypothetical protein